MRELHDPTPRPIARDTFSGAPLLTAGHDARGVAHFVTSSRTSGYQWGAAEPLDITSRLESSLASPNARDDPFLRAHHESPEDSQYYGAPGPPLYSPYEPLIPRLGVKSPLQQMPFPSRAEEEEPEQLTYDDSVKAGLMIQLALISRSTAEKDAIDDLAVPATLPELGRSIGGIELLL